MLLAGLSACSVSSVDTAALSAAGCGDSSCFNNDASTDGGTSNVSTDVGTSDGAEEAFVVNALCGTGCLPDDPLACSGSGSVADAGDAVADAAQDSAEAGYGGAHNKSPQPIPSPDGSPSPQPAFTGAACQVVPDSDGQPVAKCSAFGPGQAGSPCVSASDCAPGLACVGDATTGECRPYCCAGADACAAGTWCSEQASRDALLATPSVLLMVPVCVPGDDCKLLTDPADDMCPDGTVCTVVRNDGTLACLAPGTVDEGGTCDSHDLRCAPGLVCSRSSMTCLKLCSVNADDCGSGVCQAGTTGLPDSIGICVGGSDN